MKKVVGYVIAVVGLAVMALGFNIFPFEVALLEGIAGNYIAGVGIAIIIVGVVLSLKGSGGSGGGKIKRAEEEIPIYEGTGKNRKIVGYRKD